MKKIFLPLLVAACWLFAQPLRAQQNVGINTTAPHPSAALDVVATDKGVLIPRLTFAQRSAIASPATGLLIYQTDPPTGFHYFDGFMWNAIGGAGGGQWAGSLNDIFNTNTGSVGIGTSVPAPSAKLEVASTEKGVLLPRMTMAQRNAIVSPANGLLIFQTDNNPGFYYSNGAAWLPVGGGSGGASYSAGAGISISTANVISNTGDLNAADDIVQTSQAGGDVSGPFSNLQIAANAVGSNEIANGSVTTADLAAGVLPANLPPSGAAGGDLGGNYPNPQVQKIQGRTVSDLQPTNDQVLKFKASVNQWMPFNDGLTIPFAHSSFVNGATQFQISNQGTGIAAAFHSFGNLDSVPTLRASFNNGNKTAILAKNTGTGFGIGVAGLGYGANGALPVGDDIGVYGESQGYGVRGVGGSRGIFGSTSAGVGGYFEATTANGKAAQFYHPANGTAVFVESGNVGIHNGNPLAPLHFSNTHTGRKIVLHGSANNQHQFYGFGTVNGAQNYHVPSTFSSHKFLAATSDSTSQELARIEGDGDLVLRRFLTVDDADNSTLGKGIYFGSLNSGEAIGSNRSAANDNHEGLDFWTNGSKRFSIKNDGKIRVGASTLNTPGTYKLYVEGGILTEKVRVAVKNTANWADYVFAPDYHLRPLAEVEKFVQENRHLPGVPSAEEVVKEGVGLAEMDAKLLEKIEELTLYLIDLKKEVDALKAENASLKLQKQ